MRKIFLTVNINCQDEFFQELIEFNKLNIGDILKKTISFKSGELESNRARLVFDTIFECSDDLLIGYAIQQKGQLSDIIQLIENDELTISKIFYDAGTRKEKEIKKYKEKYKLHSNWMDYSPEYIVHQYKQFEKIIDDIKIEAKDNNIIIEAI